MSDPAPPPPATAPPRAAARRSSANAAWILLALAAVAAWLGWRWWDQRTTVQAAQVGQLERIEALEVRFDALRRDQRANAERLQQAAATNRLLREELLGLGQRAALLEDSVADLTERSAGGAHALRMDEADLLLATAAQRLLAGDLGGADRAYGLAAAALERVESPDAMDLRQALAQEREALAALGADPAIAARAGLDALAAALPTLPRQAPRTVPDSAPWWRRLAARVVDVRPTVGGDVVAPAERAAGLAALEVEIALARGALERRDAAALDAALARIDGWLVRLWPASGPLQAQRRALRALRGRPLRLEAPELGSTLAQLRRQRAG